MYTVVIAAFYEDVLTRLFSNKMGSEPTQSVRSRMRLC